MLSVRQWLNQLGLPEHADVFERNALELDLLCELTDEDLEKLGVHALGHRKRRPPKFGFRIQLRAVIHQVLNNAGLVGDNGRVQRRTPAPAC